MEKSSKRKKEKEPKLKKRKTNDDKQSSKDSEANTQESNRSLGVIGSSKVANFEQLRSEELKKICREKSCVKNRALWLQVLCEIDRFKEKVTLQINSIHERLPKLATLLLFNKELIDQPEVERVALKQSQLKSALNALTQAAATISKSERKESFIPLDKEWCPLIKSLVEAIYEHKRITQEIETGKDVEAIHKELIKDKVNEVKVCDPKMFDLAPMLQQKETSRLAVLEIKRKIIPDYQEA